MIFRDGLKACDVSVNIFPYGKTSCGKSPLGTKMSVNVVRVLIKNLVYTAAIYSFISIVV